MEVKMLEIRDICTTIPVIAIKTASETADEMKFFDRAGFCDDSVILIKATGYVECECDCYDWRKDGTRTMFHAHQFIVANFDDIPNMSVIDIEFILNESEAPKKSEIWR